ncbi:MAG: folate-binding protein YgfZ [Frankiales bacterium]|nr:folate-binding protein YgfZ [Frankiales bacterium]
MSLGNPALERPGAVPAIGLDSGVAAHYGDPYREQRRLADGAAEVDLSHRPVIQISGPDRLTWLNDLTSQLLLGLASGVTTETLVLSPSGHVEHHLQLVDDGNVLLAHVEPGTAGALVSWLDRMRFMLRVEVSDVSPSWSVVGTSQGWRLVPRGTDLGPDLAGVDAWEALRVEAQRPRLGPDTDHRTIPNETSWLSSAVHLAKGCYRGQETVARVANLGRPPRRLALLHLDGSDSELPSAGDDLLLDGRAVGRVGTAVRHHELGPIALALVKRQVPTDAGLTVAGIAAALEPEVQPLPERHVRPTLMRF